MKGLEQKHIDILKENGWSISSYEDDGTVCLQKFSPAGKKSGYGLKMYTELV